MESVAMVGLTAVVGRVVEEAAAGVMVILGAGTRDRRAADDDEEEDACIAGAMMRYQPTHTTSAPKNAIKSQSRMRCAYAAASEASITRTMEFCHRRDGISAVGRLQQPYEMKNKRMTAAV